MWKLLPENLNVKFFWFYISSSKIKWVIFSHDLSFLNISHRLWGDPWICAIDYEETLENSPLKKPEKTDKNKQWLNWRANEALQLHKYWVVEVIFLFQEGFRCITCEIALNTLISLCKLDIFTHYCRPHTLSWPQSIQTF